MIFVLFCLRCVECPEVLPKDTRLLRIKNQECKSWLKRVLAWGVVRLKSAVMSKSVVVFFQNNNIMTSCLDGRVLASRTCQFVRSVCQCVSVSVSVSVSVLVCLSVC